MLYVGIDTGADGGLSYVSSKGLTCSFVMPTMDELPDILNIWHRDFTIRHVFLEYSQAFPKMGKKHIFTYGRHFGEIIGALRAGMYPYTLVPPQQWQAEMFKGTRLDEKPKKRALTVAKRLFPNETFLKTQRCTKLHDGMIDSILIAEYCRRMIR